MESFESQLVFKKDNGTKLTGIILNVKAVFFTFYDCVTSAYTYIVNSNLTFVSTP